MLLGVAVLERIRFILICYLFDKTFIGVHIAQVIEHWTCSPEVVGLSPG